MEKTVGCLHFCFMLQCLRKDSTARAFERIKEAMIIQNRTKSHRKEQIYEYQKMS